MTALSEYLDLFAQFLLAVFNAVFLLCYAALLKNSTHYAYINAQCWPIMLNNVLHLLYTLLNIPTLWIENE